MKRTSLLPQLTWPVIELMGLDYSKPFAFPVEWARSKHRLGKWKTLTRLEIALLNRIPAIWRTEGGFLVSTSTSIMDRTNLEKSVFITTASWFSAIWRCLLSISHKPCSLVTSYQPWKTELINSQNPLSIRSLNRQITLLIGRLVVNCTVIRFLIIIPR